MKVDFLLRAMEARDWPDVRKIYREGIESGNATFETAAPDWIDWDQDHLKCCRLLAIANDSAAGWAALSPVSERCVYQGVAEVSVYVTRTHRKQGIGKLLLNGLIKESESAGIWTLQAGMFPENQASIALHLACGFRKVGIRERLGQINGAWRDVVLMERRSPAI